MAGVSPPDPQFLEDWRANVQAEKALDHYMEVLVPANSIIWVTGKPKLAKKTWLSTMAIRHLCKGENLGPFGVSAPVLPCAIVQLEGSKKNADKRFRMMDNGAGWEVPKESLYYFHHWSLNVRDDTYLHHLRTFVKSRGIKVLMIDSFAKSMKGDENSFEDVTDYFNRLDTIRALGCSIIVIDHLKKGTSKGDEDEDTDLDEEGRGSSVKAGHYDLAWHIRTFGPNRDAQRIIMTTTSRESESHMYDLDWDIRSGENERISVAFEEIPMGGSLPDPLLASCIDSLDYGPIYKDIDLVRLWRYPREVFNRIIHDLDRTSIHKVRGGWKKGPGEEA